MAERASATKAVLVLAGFRALVFSPASSPSPLAACVSLTLAGFRAGLFLRVLTVVFGRRLFAPDGRLAPSSNRPDAAAARMTRPMKKDSSMLAQSPKSGTSNQSVPPRPRLKLR